MGCKDKYCTILDIDQILFTKFEDFGDWYKIIITFRHNIKTDLIYGDLDDATNDYNAILKHMTAERYELLQEVIMEIRDIVAEKATDNLVLVKY